MTSQNIQYKSQSALILEHLRSRGSITPLDALRLYGCFRLGGRIYDLKRAGHTIVTEMVEDNGKHYARYRLVEANTNGQYEMAI